MVVLAWIQKPHMTWTTFVAIRVSKIVEKVGRDKWRHVKSEYNPADLNSRRAWPQDLINNSLW